MGKYNGPPARTAIFTRSGGDGGGGFERRKPIVRINKVIYDEKEKKYINIVVKEIINNDNIKY
ncbi:hypothetical protein KKF82_06305 [Patescibacteria group bacterium]|nr:hypothetical protein [Patescibacteria group bacterium]